MSLRRFLPDSLFGWMLTVLVGGLLLSQLAALLLFAGHRGDLLDRFGAHAAAERIVAVTRAVASAPPAERASLVDSLDVPGLRVMLTAEPLVRRDERNRLAHALHEHLEEVLEDMGEHDVEVRVEVGGMHPRHRGQPDPGRGFRVSVPLSDGSWLSFMAPLDRPAERLWGPSFGLPFLLMLLVVGGGSIWAVRRATRSFAGFADAAERLGRDVATAPMPETGPREVRQAAAAFNRMQTRLGRFVADRTQMLAAISHDLRTPITRLRLRAEFVEDEEQRTKMLADLDEMEAMIKATLSFARDDAAHEPRRPLDLAALLAELVGDAVAAGHRADYDGPPALIVEAAPVALKRALANLIDNALRYGGAAHIGLTAGDELLVVIEDEGPGIPAAERERVFAPFTRLETSRNRETGGTGLGLSVARSVIRAHGGDVTLDDRPGGGLRVTVSLPAAASPAPNAG